MGEKLAMDARRSILVTGGAGFLGSHLCERLVRKGLDVCCIDNFSTGAFRNIRALVDAPNFHLVRGDVTQEVQIDASEIYNFASPASPVQYQRDPLGTAKTNLQGAMNVLDLARRRKGRVLQASTSEIYGDPLVHPQGEDYWGHVNPIGPRACYNESKRCAETLFFDYWRVHSLPVKLARIFNTYGPRMLVGDGRVVSNFVVQALLGRSITVQGSGLQTRSFCFVDDLIEGIILFMETPDDFVGPLNLGNPQEHSILELAEIIIDLTGSSSRVVHMPEAQDDPRRRRPDISRAKELLGWQPTTSLREGLGTTICYFEALLSEIGQQEVAVL